MHRSIAYLAAALLLVSAGLVYAAPSPSVTLTILQPITTGQSVRLSWSSTGANNCRLFRYPPGGGEDTWYDMGPVSVPASATNYTSSITGPLNIAGYWAFEIDCSAGNHVVLSVAVVRVTVAPCQNGTGNAGSCTSCNAGYVSDGFGSCVAQPASVSTLTLSPGRVRAGGVVYAKWTSVGMTSCTLRDNTNVVKSTALNPAGSGVPLTILKRTTFTLICSNSTNLYTRVATATLSASFSEY
ncbi:hypothetical protein EXS62_02480 [Candidatus Kaiserbacteria bacterium]|nr:hypothetical protein [Candidatus Kaiserbacteria bacterium]